MEVAVRIYLEDGNSCEFFYSESMFEKKSQEFIEFFQEGNTQKTLVFQTKKAVTVIPKERIIYIDVIKK